MYISLKIIVDTAFNTVSTKPKVYILLPSEVHIVLWRRKSNTKQSKINLDRQYFGSASNVTLSYRRNFIFQSYRLTWIETRSKPCLWWGKNLSLPSWQQTLWKIQNNHRYSKGEQTDKLGHFRVLKTLNFKTRLRVDFQSRVIFTCVRA